MYPTEALKKLDKSVAKQQVINAPAVFVEIWRVLSVLIAPTTAAMLGNFFRSFYRVSNV